MLPKHPEEGPKLRLAATAMSTFYLPRHHTPANGVAPRTVPNQLAPERCITHVKSMAPEYVVLVGRDLSGTIRVKLELHRDDVSVWWLKVLRHWLAWAYSASEIKIVS
jgi:hypothetical protein